MDEWIDTCIYSSMLCQSNRHHTGWIRLGFSMRAGDAHHIRHSIRFKFIPWKGWHFQNIHLTATNLCTDFFLPETSLNILYQYAICINLPHVFRPNRAPQVAWASASSARRAPRCDEYDTWRERKRAVRIFCLANMLQTDLIRSWGDWFSYNSLFVETFEVLLSALSHWVLEFSSGGWLGPAQEKWRNGDCVIRQNQ